MPAVGWLCRADLFSWHEFSSEGNVTTKGLTDYVLPRWQREKCWSWSWIRIVELDRGWVLVQAEWLLITAPVLVPKSRMPSKTLPPWRLHCSYYWFSTFYKTFDKIKSVEQQSFVSVFSFLCLKLRKCFCSKTKKKDNDDSICDESINQTSCL